MDFLSLLSADEAKQKVVIKQLLERKHGHYRLTEILQLFGAALLPIN
jgi:hypothetical protein